MIMKYNHSSDCWTETDDYEKIFNEAALDTRTPWLPAPPASSSWCARAPEADTRAQWRPAPPVPDTEESESRGVPNNLVGIEHIETDDAPMKSEAQKRKEQPLYSGCFAYFPDALLAVAELSFIGNQQHNPGQPLHWSREKSADHPDCELRHLLGRGTLDSDGVRHSTKRAWRALADLQLELEAARGNDRA